MCLNCCKIFFTLKNNNTYFRKMLFSIKLFFFFLHFQQIFKHIHVHKGKHKGKNYLLYNFSRQYKCTSWNNIVALEKQTQKTKSCWILPKIGFTWQIAIKLLFIYKCSCKHTQLVNLEKLLQFFDFLDKLQCPQKGFGLLRLGQIP